jgi:hypothetical protein
LHAYYLEHIRDGNTYPYEEHYRQNRNDPDAATERELNWWQNTSSSPEGAGEFLHDYFPMLNQRLSKDRLLGLSKEEFADMCVHIHALHDHSSRVSWKTLGLPDKLPHMSASERARYFGRWLYDQYSNRGRTTLETIYYVLHAEPLAELPSRIFEVWFDSELKIPHLGLSSLGEMAGWAHPNEFPPRNGRTSKSLRGLGYSVRVYGE